MSSEQKPFVTDDTQVQTGTHNTRMAGAGNRFNLKPREAFSSSPFILTRFDKFMNWIHGSSVFMLWFSIACYSVEMMHTYSVKHDLDRSAAGTLRVSPRQTNMIIVPGAIVSKFVPRMKRVYDQMSEPKFVVGMGSYTISGGPFQEGYNVIRGIEEVISVGIHAPGCPPRPEALIYDIAKLQERITSGEPNPVTVKPYELEQLGNLERGKIVDKFAGGVDEEDLVMWYSRADSP